METKLNQLKEALERFGCTRMHVRHVGARFDEVQFIIPAGLQVPVWRFLAELEGMGAWSIEFRAMTDTLDLRVYLTIDKLTTTEQ